ncbi:replication factor A protein 2 [Acarospora aff. strigata]|nr:replication factor A protein 2 [Acarospora aff. strigata]
MPPESEAQAKTDQCTVNGKKEDTLQSVCAELHARVSAFLAEDPVDNRLRSVQEQTRTSLGVISEALNRYTFSELSLSYNGGKDCLVLLILFLTALHTHTLTHHLSLPPLIQSVYIVSQHPFPEVESFVATSSHTYHLDLARYAKPMKAAFAEYLEEKQDVKAIFVGTRRTDPHGEELTFFDATDRGWPRFMRVHPVIDWHYAEIWSFIRHLDIPYCELYDKGYTSLGGTTDTHPNPALKASTTDSEVSGEEGFWPAYELVEDDYNAYNQGQYSTTSYGAQGGAGGGGFTPGSQGGSQDTPGGVSKYGKDTLRPVTIKQVIDAQQPHPDGEFKIDGVEITQITFIGQIRNISSQATNITYKLDDGTGTMEIKLWVDSESSSHLTSGMDTTNGTDPSKPRLVENAYARVWGRLKAFNNKRHVGAHVIRPLADYNEIQYHLLEAAYAHLYFTRGPPEQFAAAATEKGAPGVNGGRQQGQQQQQDGGYGDAAGGAGSGPPLHMLSVPARRVFNTLKSSPQNNEGLHVQNIAAQLGLQVSDVLKAGDELLGHGRIYTTIDDNTWAILDL